MGTMVLDIETRIEWYDPITGSWFTHHADPTDRSDAFRMIEAWRRIDSGMDNCRYRVVTTEEV